MKSPYPLTAILALLICMPLMVGTATASPPASDPQLTAQFAFYNSPVRLRYSQELVHPYRAALSEEGISSYYKLLRLCPYQDLLEDLKGYKSELSLNDWLFYKLIYTAVDHIWRKQGEKEKELLCWFLLSELGYDTRLTYLKDQVFIYVYSEDTLFEIPLIRDQGRTYANLTSYRRGKALVREELFLLQYKPRSGGRPFSFYLTRHPRLPADVIRKDIHFAYRGEHYIFPVEVNQTIVEVMEDYPYFSESQYLEVPLSSFSFNTLVPHLRRIIHGKSSFDALQLLAAFTRSSFQYKEDKSFFGKSKPMIADEVLYYPYSDCEDRSALFFQLVKTLLDLPMVAIAYEDHLTIGIASQELSGDAVWFKGRRYFICDPTGPPNSDVIGKFPQGYENKSFHIIGYYK